MDKTRQSIVIQICPIVLVILFAVIAVGAAETAAKPPAREAEVAAKPAEQRIVVTRFPHTLRVEEGNVAFLEGHGVGTQDYVCRATDSGVAYALFTPQATLFDDDGHQIITHFFSPNPQEPNTDSTVVADRRIRATWESSHDSSRVWAKQDQAATFMTDPTFVRKDAIAWLLLDVEGTRPGPTGGDKLAQTTFIQRLNTTGGLAPSMGCSSPSDLGNEAFVPYTADYFFYKKAGQ